MPTSTRTKKSTARSGKSAARAASGSRGRGATARAATGGAPKTRAAAPKGRPRSAKAKTKPTATTKKRRTATAAKAGGKRKTRALLASGAGPAKRRGRRAQGSGPAHEASEATMKAHAALTPMQGKTDLDGHDPETIAFLGGPRARDPVVEEMAMDALRAATSGEDESPELRPGERAFELGGPFVETRPGTELAYDDLPPNVEDAEPAAVPTTHDVGGPATRSHGEVELEPDVPISRSHGSEDEEGPEDGYRA